MPMSIPGVFESLLREFMSGQMICLAMGGSSGDVSVSGEIVELRGSVMRTLWHLVISQPVRCRPRGLSSNIELST
jgi:hypothetical protein